MHDGDYSSTAAAAVVITYASDHIRLAACVDSILRQRSEQRPDVLVIDTGSAGEPGRLSAFCEQRHVRLLELPSNPGYGAAVNAGVRATVADTVLVVNDDVVIDDGALDLLVAALRADDRLAGISPVLRRTGTDTVDAAGMVIRQDGDAWNRRQGQPLSSLPRTIETVQGLCFAAALVRRSAFAAGAIGPMEERFFMYWEDAEWCLRGALRGWRFAVHGSAFGDHEHSATVSAWPFSRKYRLVERNQMLAAARTLPARQATRLIVERLGAHVLGLVRGPYRKDRVPVILQTLAGLPGMLRRREPPPVGADVAGFYALVDGEPLPLP